MTGDAPLMATMMLPGALPAAATRVRVRHDALSAIGFAGAYFVLWLAVGAALAMVWPDTTMGAAGLVTIAAGVYELSPFKRACRRRCFDHGVSPLAFGMNCVGSSIGLMAMLAALDVMSVWWMAAVAGVVVAQKLVPPNPWLDLPLGAAIVAFGTLVLTGAA